MTQSQDTLIKRYANRRLYDTRTSAYVTLDDLLPRVRAGESLRVVDAKTGEDLTHRVLLQLIVLEGSGIGELLPREFLYALLRLREPAGTELFLRYLRMSLEAFRLARGQMEANMRRFREQSALAAQWMAGLFPGMTPSAPGFPPGTNPFAGGGPNPFAAAGPAAGQGSGPAGPGPPIAPGAGPAAPPSAEPPPPDAPPEDDGSA